MGRGKGRKYRKRNGAQGGEKLTPSEPSSTIKEKRPGDVSDLPIITVDATAAPLRSYCLTGTAAVGLDSRIYRIGGLCSSSRDVYILEKGYRSSGCTAACKGRCHAEVFCVEVDGQGQPNNNNEWKRCAPMNIGRKDPLACAVDGKIYVFGGAPLGDFGPFIGEVYDPVEDKWDKLPPLADFEGYSPISPMNVVLDDPKDATNKLILVHIQGTQPLYAFNVRRKIWECFDDKFGWVGPDKDFRSSPAYRMSPTNAVVDNFLYCFSAYRKVFAYDLNGKEWHHLNGQEWHPIHAILKKESESDVFLFHLGGNTLCFLWSYGIFCGQFPDVSADVIIGCAKFKVDGKSSQSLRLGYFRHKVPDYGPVHYVQL
ncbi:Kelch repeat type 2 [Corchorus olitorius]|uniref:Kelch repeat type 2 n=1 Tax=Corchorus olitorius TaxID=93759 RepID=A0A1R3KAT7_9ROSI|nr:Kelch repeat type 2 [Corchorus olitorius]